MSRDSGVEHRTESPQHRAMVCRWVAVSIPPDQARPTSTRWEPLPLPAGPPPSTEPSPGVGAEGRGAPASTESSLGAQASIPIFGEAVAPVFRGVGPRLYPDPVPGFGPQAVQRSRSGVLPWLVLALVVVLAVVSAWSRLGPSRTDALGPDHSGVVLSRASTELPPPLVTSRVDPRPGFEETGAPLGTPPVAVRPSTSYAFQHVQDATPGSTIPVTWSPCRPIHFVVNPHGAPPGFVTEVVASVGALSVATGLVFANDGLTTEQPSDERKAFQPELYGDRWAPVVIAFADHSILARTSADAVGLAGSQRVQEPRTGTYTYVTGEILLDTALVRWPDRDGIPEYVPVLRHELGHLVGLDHVDDRDQLMYPTVGAPVTYQKGDLAGLALLGQGACAPWI